jgi:hypothetical protein
VAVAFRGPEAMNIAAITESNTATFPIFEVPPLSPIPVRTLEPKPEHEFASTRELDRIIISIDERHNDP